MKHKAASSLLAAALAALVLAGCGAETAVSASAAAKPAGSKQPAVLTATSAEPDSMMEPETVLETENAETPRITEQIALEKQCSAGYTGCRKWIAPSGPTPRKRRRTSGGSS